MNNYKKIYIIIIILISILFLKNCFNKKNKIEKLNYTNINKNKIILFETQWCEYSQQFKKIWNELELKLKNKDLFFINYDCDKFNDICKKNDIFAYPTIKFINKNKEEFIFKNKRTYENIYNFIKSHL